MPKKQAKQETPSKPNFEEAMDQLEAIVDELEQGEASLDKSLARYEQGVKLLRQCYEILDGAERQVEVLSGVDADGNPLTKPLDE